MQWFRLYAEFANDPKVQMMSEAAQRRLVMLFCFKCNDDVTLQDEQVAFQLRISAEEWAITKADFVRRGFIDKENNIVNWERRQFKSDQSNERVKKFREKKKRDCNVTVTTPEAEQIQKQSRTDTTLSARATDAVPPFTEIYDHGSAVFPALASRATTVIREWLKAGAVPQDAIGEIDRAKAQGKEIKSWGYFTGGVMDAVSTRLNPLPCGKPRAAGEKKTHHQKMQEAAVNAVIEAGGGT